MRFSFQIAPLVGWICPTNRPQGLSAKPAVPQELHQPVCGGSGASRPWFGGSLALWSSAARSFLTSRTSKVATHRRIPATLVVVPRV